MATIRKHYGKWQARVRLQGFPEQSQTFTRKRDATDWANDIESAMKKGEFDADTASGKRTVADMIDRYIAEDTRKDRDKTAMQLRWWRDELGAYAIKNVTPAVITAKREKLAKRRNARSGEVIAPATVNRYLAALSAAFTKATREWHWIRGHPMINKQVGRKTEPRGRVRWLSDDERTALLDACRDNDKLYLIVLLAISTGMRRGEIRALRWSDLDLANKRLILRNTKNNEDRAAYLSGEALELMRERAKVRPLHDGLVFGSVTGRPYDFDHPFADAVKRAGINDFCFHDCRHTAASYLAMSGATLAELAAILGHKTLAMVKRYSHLAEGHQSKVVERMVRERLS